MQESVANLNAKDEEIEKFKLENQKTSDQFQLLIHENSQLKEEINRLQGVQQINTDLQFAADELKSLVKDQD